MHLVVNPHSTLVTVRVLPVVQMVDVGSLDVSEHVDVVKDVWVGPVGRWPIGTHIAEQRSQASALSEAHQAAGTMSDGVSYGQEIEPHPPVVLAREEASPGSTAGVLTASLTMILRCK